MCEWEGCCGARGSAWDVRVNEKIKIVPQRLGAVSHRVFLDPAQRAPRCRLFAVCTPPYLRSGTASAAGSSCAFSALHYTISDN
eukprot:3861144-Prymnesium_polylepis.1